MHVILKSKIKKFIFTPSTMLSVRKESEYYTVNDTLSNVRSKSSWFNEVRGVGESTLDSSPRRDDNNNDVLVTMGNLNPYVIVYLMFKMLLSLTSSIKY